MALNPKTLGLEIQVFDGDKLIAEKSFEQGKIVIGRIQSADFRVPDTRLSRIHALIECLETGAIRITDLASTHGTFVNGERVVERSINLTDKIQLASLTIKLALKAMGATQRVEATSGVELGGGATPISSAKSSSSAKTTVRTSQDPTVIRSLKETAQERGVLAPSGAVEDLEVNVYWEDTILNIDHIPNGKSVFVGSQPSNDYVIPMPNNDRKYRLLKTNTGSAEIFLTPDMKGSVRRQGELMTLEQVRQKGGSLILSGDDLAKIQIGPIHFFLRFVARPPHNPRAPFFDQGPAYWVSQGIVVALVAAFGMMAVNYQPPIEGIVKEFPEKYRRIIVENMKKKMETPPPVVQAEAPKPKGAELDVPKPKDPTPKGNEGEGARAKGPEGKRGNKNAANETGMTKRPKTQNPKVKDAEIRQKNEGLISGLKNSGLGTKLAKVAGVDEGASGHDTLGKALSGVGSTEERSGRGSGGSGLQGTGTGGGGTSESVAGLGNKGFGGGAKGTGVGSVPGKQDYSVGTEAGSEVIMGGLTAEQIARVVRAHLNEVNFCYQRALATDPSLFGKISFRWVIAASGVVSTVGVLENATRNKSLEDCVADKVKTWRFPSNPVQSTQVDWPFVFKPRGN